MLFSYFYIRISFSESKENKNIVRDIVKNIVVKEKKWNFFSFWTNLYNSHINTR